MSLSHFDKTLDASIAALSDKDAIYALIDPTFENFAESDESTEYLRRARRLELRIGAFPHDKRPYLVCLGRYDHNERTINVLLRRALEEACGIHDQENYRLRSVCALMCVSSSAESSLATRMSAAAMLVECSGEPAVFRYWDPRIMSQLPRVLGERACCGRLSDFGIDTWWCYDSAKSLPTLTEIRALDTKAAKENEPASCKWNLSREQLRGLEVLSWANRLTGLVTNWGVEPTPRLEYLEKIVMRAMAHGGRYEADILRFVYAALMIHPSFETHPAVAKELAHAPSFAITMQNWTPEFTEELKAGAWLTNSPHEKPRKTTDKQ